MKKKVKEISDPDTLSKIKELIAKFEKNPINKEEKLVKTETKDFDISFSKEEKEKIKKMYQLIKLEDRKIQNREKNKRFYQKKKEQYKALGI